MRDINNAIENCPYYLQDSIINYLEDFVDYDQADEYLKHRASENYSIDSLYHILEDYKPYCDFHKIDGYGNFASIDYNDMRCLIIDILNDKSIWGEDVYTFHGKQMDNATFKNIVSILNEDQLKNIIKSMAEFSPMICYDKYNLSNFFNEKQTAFNLILYDDESNPILFINDGSEDSDYSVAVKDGVNNWIILDDSIAKNNLINFVEVENTLNNIHMMKNYKLQALNHYQKGTNIDRI